MFKRILLGISAGFLVYVFMIAVTSKTEAKSDLTLNWGSELNANKCDNKVTDEPILNITHKVVNDIDSGFQGYWAYDNYNKHIQVWPTSVSKWEVNGEHGVVFTLSGGGDYPHTMNVTSFDQNTGNFSGTGYYNDNVSVTWDVTGNITGNNVTFQIVYNNINPGYTVDGTGTIAGDGSATGTATGPGQTFTWVMNTGSFVMSAVDYCAIVQYEGKFKAVEGMNSPGQGSSKVLTGDENGTMLGGYRATFSGTFNPGDKQVEGFVGEKDYQCDINNPASCQYWSWATEYFPGYTNFDQPWWGWIYKSSKYGTWINALSGSLGDIATP